MKKKIILSTSIIIFFIISLFFFYIFFTGPNLPSNTNKIIENVILTELPEQARGESAYVNSSGVKIWYESIKPAGSVKGNILLIMGIANDAFAWPDYFITSLLKKGYRIIRFDHRGTGMSDWISDWESKKYTLDDMSLDCISIMDKLKIKKFHVVSVSLGGMVGQQLSILHPERILSLASLMSSGFITDPELPQISIPTIIEIIKVYIKYNLFNSESNSVKFHLAARTILRKEDLPDHVIKMISEQVIYNIRKRKGFNPDASQQHQAAVIASGSRYEKLEKLQIPTVIIHGKSDPLINVAHGIKCAKLIPGAISLFIEGMGHDIPLKYNENIIKKIIENIQRSK